MYSSHSLDNQAYIPESLTEIQQTMSMAVITIAIGQLVSIKANSFLSATKKPRQWRGFFVFDIPEGKRMGLNAWSTADAYALCADQPSYVQPYERHE